MKTTELVTLLDLQQRIKDLTIGRSIDWKPGLITYNIHRLGDNLYELSHTSDGWWDVHLSQDQVVQVIEGRIKLSTLNWM